MNPVSLLPHLVKCNLNGDCTYANGFPVSAQSPSYGYVKDLHYKSHCGWVRGGGWGQGERTHGVWTQTDLIPSLENSTTCPSPQVPRHFSWGPPYLTGERWGSLPVFKSYTVICFTTEENKGNPQPGTRKLQGAVLSTFPPCYGQPRLDFWLPVAFFYGFKRIWRDFN